MSVYDVNAFHERVRHAARAIVSGHRSGFDGYDATQTRAFDTCFEMYDGDAVVVALMRRRERDPDLYAALTAYLTPTSDHWERTAKEYAHVADRDLPRLSRMLIRQAETAREKREAAA